MASRSGRSSRSSLIGTKRSFISRAVAPSSNDSRSITWHQWQAEQPIERRIGVSSSRARARASSPHGYQSTGLSLCWSRYGEVSPESRLGMSMRLPGRIRCYLRALMGVRALGGAAVALGLFLAPAAAADDFTVVQANVGNLNVPGCQDQVFRLCQRPVERRVTQALHAIRPDLAALEEVLPPEVCVRAP